jgi:hypothetical protein
MAERIVREVDDAPVATQRVSTVRDDTVAGTTIVARVIWYVAGVLLALLAFRFVLAALGANPNNAFADFIYTTSNPFVSPFFSLFGYDLQLGVARFEIFTLVAMGVYALIAWGLARLATLTQPHPA